MLGSQRLWPDWDSILHDRSLLKDGPFFLELFARLAGLTEAVHLAGVPVLPPVDIVPSPLVTTPRDLVDYVVWRQLLEILAVGVVFFLHCGTPCNTFTSARKEDGGPPPLRSAAQPLGLDALSLDNANLVFLGNLFLERAVEACFLVFSLGGDFLIENPLLSLRWLTPQLTLLVRRTRAFHLDCDQCAFGTPWRKPTKFVCSSELLDALAVPCPGGHVHKKLKGKVWDPQQQRMVFKTKQAQVYPLALCATIAQQIAQIFAHQFSHFHKTFQLRVPGADRKRALHSAKEWAGHRQAETASKALAAGYQLKRQAFVRNRTEPGEAVQFALQLVHPFSRPAPLPAVLEEAIHWAATASQKVLKFRAAALQFWRSRALALLPTSIHWITQQCNNLMLLYGGSCSALLIPAKQGWATCAMWLCTKRCSRQPGQKTALCTNFCSKVFPLLVLFNHPAAGPHLRRLRRCSRSNMLWIGPGRFGPR